MRDVLWMSLKPNNHQCSSAMRTHALLRQPVALVCLIIALTSISPGLIAQEKRRPVPQQPSVTAPAPASPGGATEREGVRRRYGHPAGAPPQGGAAEAASSPYALAIEDGIFVQKGQRIEATLNNVVDSLRNLHNNEYNIAVSPELTKIKIADLKLKASSLEEELEALRVASGNRFLWTKAGATSGPIDPTTGLPNPQPATDWSLYSLMPDYSAPEVAQTRRNVEIFNLNALLQYEKDPRAGIQQIERIILDTLVQLKQDNWTPDQQPSYQFHPGANLLIVIGRQDALEVARKVVLALEAQAHMPGFGGFGGGAGGPQPAGPAQPAPQIPPGAKPNR